MKAKRRLSLRLTYRLKSQAEEQEANKIACENYIQSKTNQQCLQVK